MKGCHSINKQFRIDSFLDWVGFLFATHHTLLFKTRCPSPNFAQDKIPPPVPVVRGPQTLLKTLLGHLTRLPILHSFL